MMMIVYVFYIYNLVKPMRFDSVSGLPVYSISQLGIGRGGNTPLCPFDCDCCH